MLKVLILDYIDTYKTYSNIYNYKSKVRHLT